MRSLLTLLPLVLAACHPTYAPPVRSVHHGAPARRGAAEGEVALTVSSFLTGGPSLALPVAEALHLEVAADLAVPAMADGPCEAWSMASAGLRWTPVRPAGERGVAVDLEAGMGAGLGGADEGDEVPGGGCRRSWYERPAGGGYAGVGVGWHALEWLAPFLRLHGQATGARGIPATLWWTGQAGLELTFGGVGVALSVAAAGYHNRVDTERGVLGELGLSVGFSP